jgi:hypothetical protein
MMKFADGLCLLGTKKTGTKRGRTMYGKNTWKRLCTGLCLLGGMVVSGLGSATSAQIIRPPTLDPLPIEITRAINFVTVWNDPGVWANDFHIEFRARNLKGEIIDLSFLDAQGYFCSMPGGRTVSYDPLTQIISIDWTFPPICVDPANPAMFGFTLFGGFEFEVVEWYWTWDGVPVQWYQDVWQDWIKVNGQLVDVIWNRTTGPLDIQRTVGYIAAPVTINDVAILPLPPNPIPIDPLPIIIDPVLPVDFYWPWPGFDPSYFMYYDLYDSGGQLSARFRNVAVLQFVPLREI